jgi:tryptophan synthase alpha chain
LTDDALGSQLREKIVSGKKLLVPYITCGLPSPEGFVELYQLLAPNADAIEVGIPFSDPVMDGPVIQRSSVRALELGMTVDGCLALVKEAVYECSTPAVIMTYYNPVHSYGLARFAAASASAGVAGLIVPDLPYEECAELDEALRAQGVALVQLVAPTTSDERASMLAAASRGWVYAVSRMGVTGARQALASSAAEVVARIKPHTDLPVLLGVGISTPDLAREAVEVADGVIVGAAVVGKVLDGDLEGAASLVKSMREAIG